MADAAQILGHAPALELVDIERVYPNGTRALRGVSFAVNTGSVHGLVGANGAGKSTLIRIISGADKPTAGSMSWLGSPAKWRSPGAARAEGLATIYQNVPLVPTLSVVENVFLDRKGWRRETASMRSEFHELCSRVAYEIDPDVLVGDLPIGTRQMVCLFQALATGARMIIMDEPTSSLADAERQVVFASVRRLSEAGTTFLYVSHFLDEVIDLTDHVTVLRDGCVVMSSATSAIDESTIAGAVAGRELTRLESGRRKAPNGAGAEDLLKVRSMSTPSGLRDIDLTVRAGEVLGIAGLLGSGRSELLRAIFGADPRSGTVELSGRPVPASPAAAVRNGIAFVPEDRNLQGLFAPLTIWENISITDLMAFSRASILDTRRERARAAAAVDDLGIAAASVEMPPSELSGGNAQKVVFAKWLYTNTRLWLLDEPTAGVDVGAKNDLLQLVLDFAERGQAVIVVSSEFEELLAVSSRIVVLRQGRVSAHVDPSEIDEEKLLMLCNGITPGTHEERR